MEDVANGKEPCSIGFQVDQKSRAELLGSFDEVICPPFLSRTSFIALPSNLSPVNPSGLTLEYITDSELSDGTPLARHSRDAGSYREHSRSPTHDGSAEDDGPLIRGHKEDIAPWGCDCGLVGNDEGGILCRSRDGEACACVGDFGGCAPPHGLPVLRPQVTSRLSSMGDRS